jgi:hypothetical protein
MKKTILLQLVILASFASCFKLSAQNADGLIFNQYQAQYNYAAASFVIDTGVSATLKKRAFLIWANNLQKDTVKRNLSLSEYDPNLNFLTEQGDNGDTLGSVKNMFPKKIIKSKLESAYYLLAYVANSSHRIGTFRVNSSPMIFKLDGSTLALIWARKINLSVINANNVNTIIEYNDIIQTRDKNVVLVGRYATNAKTKESVIATKLKGATGALMWQYTYQTGNTCNEGANSVAETTDGKLSLTGYVKKCSGRLFTGNADVFYMELQSTGIPVAGTYAHYIWPTNLNMWGDEITCYTSVSGKDQLIISGYVDVQNAAGGPADRQILVMNVRQDGSLVTAQHIGNIKTDVCNDLIFSKNGTSGNDYLIYLTGQTTTYPQDSSFAQAYFMYAKFNTATGISAIGEFSTFPNSTNPFGSRNGLEIKNAGDYKKFAILATGAYQPTPGAASQTYSNILIRDLNDATGNCIKQQQVPLKQFSFDRKLSTVTFDTPALKVYKEGWVKLAKLSVKQACQQVIVDPSHALNVKEPGTPVPQSSLQNLRVTPNPAQSAIMLTTTDGTKLTGNYQNAVIQIYNYAMQVEKVIRVTSAQGNSMQLPVAQLISGIYRIQLTRENEVLSCSFIKE